MVKLEGVFTTVEGDKCKEYQETHFFQNGRHVFFVGEGRIGKGKRSKPFKNHGYAEIPEGGLKEGTQLIFSWGDTYDSEGTERPFSHRMEVEIIKVKTEKVIEIKKIKDERILDILNPEDLTDKRNIGNWIFDFNLNKS